MTQLQRGGFTISALTKLLPLNLQGKVIKGFGRGSKELGCPTANIPIDPYKEILEQLPVGVYFGYAQVEGHPTYPMAASVGWNPFYKNTEKTIEIHVLNEFQEDFYDVNIKAVAIGYIRPEADFKSVEELIQAIQDDITYTKQILESSPDFEKIKASL